MEHRFFRPAEHAAAVILNLQYNRVRFHFKICHLQVNDQRKHNTTTGSLALSRKSHPSGSLRPVKLNIVSIYSLKDSYNTHSVDIARRRLPLLRVAIFVNESVEILK